MPPGRDWSRCPASALVEPARLQSGRVELGPQSPDVASEANVLGVRTETA